MIVGAISDTHDCMPMIKKAIEEFRVNKVEAVLHAGDMNSSFAAREFASLEVRFIATYGNNDGDKLMLYKTITGFGGDVIYPRAHVRLGDKSFALFHGDDTNLVESVASSQTYDYVITGHTHDVVQRRIGKTFALNPGECCGYLTGNSTVMVIDTEKETVNLLAL